MRQNCRGWRVAVGNERVCKEGKVALLLGNHVEGVSVTVMEEVGDCIMH